MRHAVSRPSAFNGAQVHASLLEPSTAALLLLPSSCAQPSTSIYAYLSIGMRGGLRSRKGLARAQRSLTGMNLSLAQGRIGILLTCGWSQSASNILCVCTLSRWVWRSRSAPLCVPCGARSSCEMSAFAITVSSKLHTAIPCF